MSTSGSGGQAAEREPRASEIVFGDFRFDRRGRVLRRNGTPVAVPLRALGVLEELLERPGQIVSKEYLLERVWHDAAVTEHALTETVRVLRLLLANGDPNRTFIETHYARGFRFRASTIQPSAQPAEVASVDETRPPPERATARSPANGRWLWLTIGLAAGALLAGAIAGGFGSGGDGPDTAGRSLAQRRFQVSAPGEIWPGGGAVAISPDGSRIAFHVDSEGLYVRSLDQIEPVPVPDTLSSLNPFFSPDGRRIAFFRQFMAGDRMQVDLDVIDLVDGRRTTVCAECGPLNTVEGLGGAWADDGSIVFAMRRGLWRVREAGGRPEPLLPPTEGQRYMWPKVLPGSRAVVFAIHRRSSVYGAQIAVMPLPSGPVRVLVEDATSPAYAATGHLLFARAGNVLAAPFDIERLELRGDAAIVLRDVLTPRARGPAQYDVSGDGSVVMQHGGMWSWSVDQLVRIDAAGTVTDLEVEPGRFSNVRVSPDGRFLAMQRSTRGDIDLWLLDLNVGSLDRLTEGPSRDEVPVFSPDGGRLAFASDRDGTKGIYQVPLNRSREPELLLATERWAYPRSWSPDGSTLTFDITNEDGDPDVWLLPLDGDRPPREFRHSPNMDWGATFSPDGRWIAYTFGADVYVASYPQPGPVHRVSRDGGNLPRWSRRGDRLFYRWDDLSSVPMSLAPEFRAGIPQAIGDVRGISSYDVHPDGTIFALQKRPRRPPKTLELVLNWFDTLRQLSPQPEG